MQFSSRGHVAKSNYIKINNFQVPGLVARQDIPISGFPNMYGDEYQQIHPGGGGYTNGMKWQSAKNDGMRIHIIYT